MKQYGKGEIAALKQLLTQTDYQAIKHSEGEISEEEYAPIREKRKAWRERINELEAALAALGPPEEAAEVEQAAEDAEPEEPAELEEGGREDGS